MNAKQPPKPPVVEDEPAEDTELAKALRAGQQRSAEIDAAIAEQRAADEEALKDVPRKAADPDEVAKTAPRSEIEDWEPLRVDENGLVWYQEEVRKPAYAKPRGRRVVTYTSAETEVVTARDKEGMTETFEVVGAGPRHTEQAKITLPSYQVGMYRDPRYPFLIHVYNEKRGFDLAEVQRYYGGAELVPAEVKRTYVENVLCYDMRTVVRAIQTEYRQLQLSGRVE